MPGGRSAKAALKRAFKAAMRISAPVCRVGVPCTRILTYHNVGQSVHEMNVTPANFREQMTWLQANRRVIPLDEIIVVADGVAITFDDGYRDNLINAAPVLREFGLPATLFMVAGRAGASIRQEENPDAAKLMDWSELKEIEALGVTIGSHTMTHRRLSSLDEDSQRAEIVESKALLEDRLGHPVTAFAYPYGSALDYTEGTVRLVREAGYTLAVSNQYGVNTAASDPWAQKRIWVDETDTMQSFQAKVNGDLDGLRLLDASAGIKVRRLLNHFMGIS